MTEPHSLLADSLPVVLAPDDRESAESYGRRLAAANGLAYRRLMSALGLRSNIPSVHLWTDSQWNALRTLGGIAGRWDKNFEGFRRRTIEQSHFARLVEYLGQEMRPTWLVVLQTRICPLCIRERAMMYEAWDLLHAPVCARHSTELLSHCTCGRPLASKCVAKAWHCFCGTPWKELPAKTASTAAYEVSSWLLSRLEWRCPAPPDMLCNSRPCPQVLQEMPLCDSLSVIDLIGTAAMTPPTDDTPHYSQPATTPDRTTIGRNNLASMVRTIEAAHPYLIDWPRSYYQLLDEVAGRNTDILQQALASQNPLRPRHIFATRIGQLLRRPPRGLNGAPITALAQAVRSYCIERWNIKPQQLRFSRECTTARAVGPAVSVAKAAHFLDVKVNEHLAKIVRESLAAFDATSDIEKQELVRLIFDDIQRRWRLHLDNSWNVNRKKIARKLDGVEIISATRAVILLEGNRTASYRMQSWDESGVISPIPEKLTHLPYKMYFKEDVEKLLDRITRLSVPILGRKVPIGFVDYATNIRRIYGGGNRKVDVIQNILSGRIPIASVSSRPALTDLYFDFESGMDSAWEVRINTLVKKDTFAPLNYTRSLMLSLWNGRHPAFDSYVYYKKYLRDRVRFLPLRNTQGGRDRPTYHYSSVDLILHEYRTGNETRYPSVNAILKKMTSNPQCGSLP